MCHRNLGIGADQVLIVDRSLSADFAYTIYNADGSRVAMCGNGARCFATYVRRAGLVPPTSPSVTVQTENKVLTLMYDDDDDDEDDDDDDDDNNGGFVTVDMGLARMEASTLSVSVLLDPDAPPDGEEAVVGIVDMGNPHAVVVVPPSASEDDLVSRWGPILESHPVFGPAKTNVGFATILSPSSIRLRVYERGVGETLACGSGACAAAALLLARNDLSSSSIRVHFPLAAASGVSPSHLDITLVAADPPSLHVLMRGPTTHVFSGLYTYAPPPPADK